MKTIFSLDTVLTLITLVIGMGIGWLLPLPFVKNDNTQLTIYTCYDMYYVDGLNLTSESSRFDIDFDNNMHMNDFVKEITLNDAKKCTKDEQ